jgi:regulator of protease activity HflC (stomatin/prohibitin superfamily)
VFTLLGTIVFIAGILVFLIGTGLAIGAKREGESGAAVGAFAFALLLGFGLIVGSCVGVVDTKKVGVVTSFKKPTGEIRQAGAYWIAPWKSVTEMDGAIQTATYEVPVQLAGGASATVTVYPAWEMAPGAAPDLFQQYKSFEAVVESLWKQQLQTTANNVFGTYNPLTNVDPKTGELKKTKTQWAEELKTALENNKLIKDSIKIHSLSIPTIAPDQGTQEALNRIVAEFAKGSVLEQQKANALKQKEITATNAEVDKVTRCLEIAEKSGKEPGLCMSNGAGVIINANK